MTPQRATLITPDVAHFATSRALRARLNWIEEAGDQSNVAFFQRHVTVLGQFASRETAADQGRSGALPDSRTTRLSQHFATEAGADAAFAIVPDGIETALNTVAKAYWCGHFGYKCGGDGDTRVAATHSSWPMDAGPILAGK